MFYTLIKKYK